MLSRSRRRRIDRVKGKAVHHSSEARRANIFVRFDYWVRTTPTLRALAHFVAFVGFVVVVMTGVQFILEFSDRAEDREVRLQTLLSNAWETLARQGGGNMGRTQAIRLLLDNYKELSGLDLSCKSIGVWNEDECKVAPSYSEIHIGKGEYLSSVDLSGSEIEKLIVDDGGALMDVNLEKAFINYARIIGGFKFQVGGFRCNTCIFREGELWHKGIFLEIFQEEKPMKSTCSICSFIGTRLSLSDWGFFGGVDVSSAVILVSPDLALELFSQNDMDRELRYTHNSMGYFAWVGYEPVFLEERVAPTLPMNAQYPTGVTRAEVMRNALDMLKARVLYCSDSWGELEDQLSGRGGSIMAKGEYEETTVYCGMLRSSLETWFASDGKRSDISVNHVVSFSATQAAISISILGQPSRLELNEANKRLENHRNLSLTPVNRTPHFSGGFGLR